VVINVISDLHLMMMRYPLMSKARLRKILMPSFHYDRLKDLKIRNHSFFVKYFLFHITFLLFVRQLFQKNTLASTHSSIHFVTFTICYILIYTLIFLFYININNIEVECHNHRYTPLLHHWMFSHFLYISFLVLVCI